MHRVTIRCVKAHLRANTRYFTREAWLGNGSRGFRLDWRRAVRFFDFGGDSLANIETPGCALGGAT